MKILNLLLLIQVHVIVFKSFKKFMLKRVTFVKNKFILVLKPYFKLFIINEVYARFILIKSYTVNIN